MHVELEPDADDEAILVQLAVVECRLHHVVHGPTGCHAGHQRTHQQAGERRIAVGEVIDIGFPPRHLLLAQPEALESGIAEIASVRRRHRVAPETEEAERAPLEAVRDLLAATAKPGQVVAVARALEDLELLPGCPAGERIACSVVECEQLRLARRRDRNGGHELAERFVIGRAAGEPVGRRRRRPAAHQHVAPEGLACEEHAAREPERGIERPLEGALEPLDLDTEVAQQALRDTAVARPRRIDQLAAAVTDDQAPVDGEFVAPGVPAEVVVIVENENTRSRARATIEPRGRQAADAGADHDEVEALLDRQLIGGEAAARARLRVRGLERAVVLAAQPGERRRIGSGGRTQSLHRRGEAGSDGQGRSVEEVATRDRGHAGNIISSLAAENVGVLARRVTLPIGRLQPRSSFNRMLHRRRWPPRDQGDEHAVPVTFIQRLAGAVNGGESHARCFAAPGGGQLSPTSPGIAVAAVCYSAVEGNKEDPVDQKIINLYDRFTHGGITRRDFLDRLTELAGSAAAAAALLPLLQNDYAQAAIVADNDARLVTDRLAYDSPKGSINGYLAAPRPKESARSCWSSTRTAGSTRISRMWRAGSRSRVISRMRSTCSRLSEARPRARTRRASCTPR